MSAKQWTACFQRAAADLVRDACGDQALGFCGRCEGWDAEYLTDLSVSLDHGEAGRDDAFGYSHLLLALETEWKRGRWDREYDFCKLADVRAERKLYACEVTMTTWENVELEVLDRFCTFWNQHYLVEPSEQVGIMVSAGDCVRAWVLRKGDRPIEVPLSGVKC